jgi:hypothetical protein
MKIMHRRIASSQRTVDGTPRKEFNQKLRTGDSAVVVKFYLGDAKNLTTFFLGS